MLENHIYYLFDKSNLGTGDPYVSSFVCAMGIVSQYFPFPMTRVKNVPHE
jgi:hypothetical protein